MISNKTKGVMPPKPKFTREEIITAALNIAKQYGIASITAQALGEALGSSARPIFTVFSKMKEVHDETIKAAIDENSSLILKCIQDEYGLSEEKAYKIHRQLWIYTHGIATKKLCWTSGLLPALWIAARAYD